MSDTDGRRPDGEQLGEVKPLGEQLEELRQKGVPCPHCQRPIEWTRISDEGKAEILAAVENGKPHEKFYSDKREDCPGAKTRAQFLRRIAKSPDGTLTLVTLTNEQVLAELRDSHATVAELQESAMRLAAALETATKARAAVATPDGQAPAAQAADAPVPAVPERVVVAQIVPPEELEALRRQLAAKEKELAAALEELRGKGELNTRLEQANETLRLEAGAFRTLVLELFKLAGMEIKGGERMTEEKKAALILVLGDALRDSRFLAEVLELTGWDKDGLHSASERMASKRATQVVRNPRDRESTQVVRGQRQGGQIDPSEAPTRVGPAPQPPAAHRLRSPRTGLGGWLGEGIAALSKLGLGGRRQKRPDKE